MIPNLAQIGDLRIKTMYGQRNVTVEEKFGGSRKKKRRGVIENVLKSFVPTIPSLVVTFLNRVVNAVVVEQHWLGYSIN